MRAEKIFLNKQAVLNKMLGKKLSLADMAPLLNVSSPQAVFYHLSGNRPVTMRTVYKFADALKCNPSEISKVVITEEEI